MCGDELHGLTVGRSLGQLEQVLDLLACVQPGAALSPDRLVRQLAPFVERLSCVVVVLLADDAPRRALLDELGRRLPCRALLVTRATSASPGVAPVDPLAIVRGTTLRL